MSCGPCISVDLRGTYQANTETPQAVRLLRSLPAGDLFRVSQRLAQCGIIARGHVGGLGLFFFLRLFDAAPALGSLVPTRLKFETWEALDERQDTGR